MEQHTWGRHVVGGKSRGSDYSGGSSQSGTESNTVKENKRPGQHGPAGRHLTRQPVLPAAAQAHRPRGSSASRGHGNKFRGEREARNGGCACRSTSVVGTSERLGRVAGRPRGSASYPRGLPHRAGGTERTELGAAGGQPGAPGAPPACRPHSRGLRRTTRVAGVPVVLFSRLVRGVPCCACCRSTDCISVQLRPGGGEAPAKSWYK